MVEVDHDKTNVEMNKVQIKLTKTKGEPDDLQAHISHRIEEDKNETIIEGLEQSLKLITETYPNLDLSVLHRVLKVSKGEITFEETLVTKRINRMTYFETYPDQTNGLSTTTIVMPR